MSEWGSGLVGLVGLESRRLTYVGSGRFAEHVADIFWVGLAKDATVEGFGIPSERWGRGASERDGMWMRGEIQYVHPPVAADSAPANLAAGTRVCHMQSCARSEPSVGLTNERTKECE